MRLREPGNLPSPSSLCASTIGRRIPPKPLDVRTVAVPFPLSRGLHNTSAGETNENSHRRALVFSSDPDGPLGAGIHQMPLVKPPGHLAGLRMQTPAGPVPSLEHQRLNQFPVRGILTPGRHASHLFGAFFARNVRTTLWSHGYRHGCGHGAPPRASSSHS